MKRPKKEDYKVKYSNGTADNSSIIKQYSKAQDLYIDHLEQLNLPVVSKSFAVGVEVEITDCIKGHEFNIGEKVELVEFDDNMWIARNEKGDEWYINEEEANVC